MRGICNMFRGISIHALREEGDQGLGADPWLSYDFYPRPPRGGRRGRQVCSRGKFLFLSTPSARRATPRSAASEVQRYISIHALREEGDASASRSSGLFCIFLSTPSARRATTQGRPRKQVHHISIHALREEGDHAGSLLSLNFGYFYPRPPRGGRPIMAARCCRAGNFYPRPP